MDNEQSKTRLVREYVRALNQGRAVLFAGAGLSIPSGGISWSSLLEDEARQIGIDVKKENDLTSVAQYIYNESGSRQLISQLLKNYIAEKGEENINHQIISSLPIHKIWTTNYDHFIEDSLTKAGKVVDVKKSVSDMTSEIDDADVTVYKMHGDIANPNDVVIIKDDYEIYDRKNELFTQQLSSDLLSYTFLFFGFSFDDPNLENILSKVRISTGDNSRRHYCILKEVNRNDAEFEGMESSELEEAVNYRVNLQHLKINDLKRYGIYAVLVKEYSEMTDLLQSIKNHYLSNKIFISGAFKEIEEFLGYKDEEAYEVAELFCRSLGERLHQESYFVKSGFGLGVGRNIISGFLKEDAKRNKIKLSTDLEIHPFPEGLDDDEQHNYRNKIMDGTGVTITLFGNKLNRDEKLIPADGVNDEYNLAKEKGQFIIPVGVTGYMAREIWKKSIRYTKVSEMNIKIGELNNSTILEQFDTKEEKIEYLLDLIFEILDLYKENIDAIHSDLKN